LKRPPCGTCWLPLYCLKCCLCPSGVAAAMALALAGAYMGATPRGSLSLPRGQEALLHSSSLTSSATGAFSSSQLVTDFTPDVGRKRFGFSHEEIDETGNAFYEGQFRLYQRSGEGTLHNPDTGLRYVGQWQRDRYHGDGDNSWPDGSRYVGQWNNDQKHGYGELICADGLHYLGQWDNGKRHGNGAQEYKNNDLYTGGWWKGMCSGLGTYYFADGSKYEGAWANGRYDGSGVLYDGEGGRERLWYRNGKLMKRQVLTKGAPEAQSRKDLIGSKVVFGHTRDDMSRPALRSKLHPSKYLTQRATGGVDLTAPALMPSREVDTASTDPDHVFPNRGRVSP